MSCDWNFYYDFNAERKLENWEVVSQEKELFTLKTEFESEGGPVVLLSLEAPPYDPEYPRILRYRVNGEWIDLLTQAATVYVYPHFSRSGARVRLKKGTNVFLAEVHGREPDPRPKLRVSLAEDFAPVESVRYQAFHVIPPEKYAVPAASPDREGFRPGIGALTTPGRFGFSKGDGVLDCAMPTLGTIDKMYLCGHPRYQKPFRWSYSTLPEGASQHGSYSPATEGIDNDDIHVNHLSVRWGAKFGDASYACTYSLASPGVITECDSGILRISGLEFAGNYRYVAIPRKNHTIEVTALHDVKDIRMAENFLLLFGCTEFPDLPLLIVFREQPKRMEVKSDPKTNRLSELVFHGCSLIITATPFGFESLQPIRPDDESFLRDVITRARFWGHAVLAYPVRCEDFFKLDTEAQTVTILQKFSYRRIEDEWHTPPLELAPFPPLLSLCEMMRSPDEIIDFSFPTKFGYLRGAFGDTSRYTIPFMPIARKFPLRDASDSTPADLLKKGMAEFFDFAGKFPETTQAYSYAGALMEPYAMTTVLMNFMEEKDRERLRHLAEERLKGTCDPERTYDYPVIDWGVLMETMPDDQEVIDLYANPAMQHSRLWNWYERTEPFTRTKYHVCYLNVCLFSSGIIREGTPEEIAGLKIPLIENDWGAGITFYYMYLCALASGSFGEIRKSWTLLKSVYSFFEKMHDWACMGSGYSDNGISWVEGGNYGVFIAFAHMAEAIGDREAYDRTVYIAAKQFALRMAVLHASQNYFCKYYGAEPWYIAKCLHEEGNPTWQFQTVPSDLWRKKFRPDGIYNLTTEGLYPELFTAMRKFHPEETETIMNLLREALADGMKVPDNSWAIMQQTASMLIDMALNPAVPRELLLHEIELAKKRGTFMTKWRGIHIFSRRLPEPYLETLLLAWDSMKHHLLWLEHWEDVQILSSDWKTPCAGISFRKNGPRPKIRCGIRRIPEKVLENGREIPFATFPSGDQLELFPKESGKIEILFPRKS